MSARRSLSGVKRKCCAKSELFRFCSAMAGVELRTQRIWVSTELRQPLTAASPTAVRAPQAATPPPRHPKHQEIPAASYPRPRLRTRHRAPQTTALIGAETSRSLYPDSDRLAGMPACPKGAKDINYVSASERALLAASAAKVMRATSHSDSDLGTRKARTNVPRGLPST